ncbi:MAG: glutamine-hydrolyzing GMP synthase [Gammaproteobacteria bacterium]|nr:glutamine-hydrolyzing GMP synthase [Gammaproteobacteria bacterium]
MTASDDSARHRSDPAGERILILDFGSQYTRLIARRVREAGVYAEIWSPAAAAEKVADFAPLGVILSGGPASAAGQAPPAAPAIVFELGIPVLGICYGMHTMAAQLGGRVESSDEREFGHARLALGEPGRLLSGIAQDGELDVWMSHGDRVLAPPAGFSTLASTDSAPVAAMADEARHYYGLQFHPEVTHTPAGARILARFVRDICGASGVWTPANIIRDHVAGIREQVGDERVVVALSGGVDSAVAAALIHAAIGDRLTAVFVDHGLLREGESDEVMAAFSEHLGVRVDRVEAAAQFMAALEGESDPEAKRKCIGRTFIEVFEAEAAHLPEVRWLAQGTIYPDVIESAAAATGGAEVIKSHHNVGGLPERMNLKLLEPLRDLFKDEVRRIGRELGLPQSLIGRHPFPGPGLAVRILGEISPERVALVRAADAIFIAALRETGLYERVSQAFAVFLPVRTVGVMGDQRRYEYVIALRAVKTTDFMTAHWARLPWEFLDEVSRRIINRVDGIARVVYDISGKPPATIEWE